ncbi:MAG: TonB-dependent receptor [Silvibacterium sp.]|nr:TonB-dependent receptor [Silvibacterium sp.]
MTKERLDLIRTPNWLKSLAALLVILPLIFAGSLSSPRAHAQAVSATLVGTISDATGAGVAGAQITITETATGIGRNTTSNESGNYTFPDLTPGTYSVVVQAQGFKKEARPSVDVVVNTTTRIDLSLQPGSATETVTVTAAPAIMQTDRADVSTNLESHTLQSMPISVNQNFQTLLTLVPGVGPPVFQHSQFFNAASSIQTEVNGQPREGNSYQIEGIDDDERTGLLQILIPPAQAIQTVDVSTSNYEAELGRAIGTVSNVIINSGTNQFHGMVTEYVQNSTFNARAYFNKTVGHLAYNYFGGGLGGPIIKDKLFFYGDYFRSPDHEANSNILTIPSPQWYTPDAAGNIDLSGPLQANGKGQIYDPATGNPDGSGRTPFPNNQIPYNRVNPVSINLMKLLPAPNTNISTSTTAPNNNYNVNLPFQKTTERYDIKIDYQITPKDHLSGRYNRQNIDVFQAPAFGAPGGGPAQGAFAGNGHQGTYSTGLNYDRAFSSTLLTEARVGVAHYGNSATPTGYGTNYATQTGIPGVNISTFTSGQVGIFMSDFTGSSNPPLIGYSASLPWIRTETNVDVVNHWTKIVRNHTFKFGIDLRRIHDDLLQDQTFSPRGAFTFMENNTSEPGAQTNIANEMASFLLDYPQQTGRDINTYFPAYRGWWFFAFGGDKWQVTPKLTLDLGLRWEFYPPATPKSAGGFSNYHPDIHSLVIAGIGSNPSNLGLNTRYTYFAPRVGFAYRATEQTVIRGGFGISYTPFEDNTYAYNYPVRANNSYQQLNAYQPALLSNGTAATFQAGFPGPVPVVVPSNGIIDVTASKALISQSYVVIPKNYHNPYVESWNVAVQQALPAQFSFQVSYVGNHGVYIGSAQNVNLPPALGLGTAGEPEFIAFKRSAATNVYMLGYSSNYNSLQLQLNRRFADSLGMITSFTWGKGLGYQTGDDGNLLFWLDQRHNYAPNDYDHRLNFEESLTYELPFGHGKRWVTSGPAAYVIGGWKLGAIISVYSGLPYNITANGGSINTPGQQQMANQAKPIHVLHHIGPGNQWFDPTSFVQPPGCPKTGSCPIVYGVTMGNVSRNKFYGPGYIQDNVSLFKTFPIHESLGLELRADAFQLSNTPQFNSPQGSITSVNFGQVTSTVGSGTGINGIGGGRSLQFSGTLRF